MSSSSNENIVDYFEKENENLIDWFDIEINQTVNSNDKQDDNDNNDDYHIIEDLVDDYDLLQILNETSNLSEKKEIKEIIDTTMNTTFLIENKKQIQEPQELKHVIIDIPESECFVEIVQVTVQENVQENVQETVQENVQETVQETVQENVQETVQETVQEIINNQEDMKEYQNDLYNYLNLKYCSLLNRLSIINNYIFNRPYMHRFGNTINNLYNRVYYFFENNMNMIYNIGIYFGIYGFVRIGYNLIIRNQYRYIRNCIRNVRYYLYNVFS